MNSTDRDDKSNRQSIPWPEWVVAMIGMLLVVGNFGYLGWRVFQEKLPPSFAANIESVEPLDQGFLVWLRVKNNGGTPVADLRLTATFVETKQNRQVTIAYLPSRSSRRAGVLTTRPVNPDEVTFDFISFNEP